MTVSLGKEKFYALLLILHLTHLKSSPNFILIEGSSLLIEVSSLKFYLRSYQNEFKDSGIQDQVSPKKSLHTQPQTLTENHSCKDIRVHPIWIYKELHGFWRLLVLRASSLQTSVLCWSESQTVSYHRNANTNAFAEMKNVLFQRHFLIHYICTSHLNYIRTLSSLSRFKMLQELSFYFEVKYF